MKMGFYFSSEVFQDAHKVASERRDTRSRESTIHDSDHRISTNFIPILALLLPLEIIRLRVECQTGLVSCRLHLQETNSVTGMHSLDCCRLEVDNSSAAR